MTEESIVHRDKDMSRFAAELADEGEDIEFEEHADDDVVEIEDIEYLDDEDFEDE